MISSENSPLDQNRNHQVPPPQLLISNSSNPSPEFSIRDYVYDLRSKDVKHWPFSDENLMVCMKHGVRNLLPPFQPIDSPKDLFVTEKAFPDNEIVTNENITPNNLKVSETMSPKVCPVCKIFTSYSNTTLNAHIDQCLFDEPKSTTKLTENPNVIKKIVKPRKMRLMVDIYRTALQCTVEELEMRNGINLSANSSFPTQEIEFHGKGEKEQRDSVDNLLETVPEDDVYIDFDGTKILKLSVPEIGAEDNNGSQKLIKRKGDELVADKNEQKTSEEKRHKLLRLSPRSEKFNLPKPPHGFEMGNNHGENFTVEVEGDTTKFLSDEELELDDDQGTKDMVSFSRTLSSPDTPISSPESIKKIDTSSSKPQDIEYVNQLPLRKRLGLRSGFSALKETQTPTLSVQPKNTISDAESSGIETKSHDEGPTIEPNSVEVYQGPFPEPEKLTLPPQPIIDIREKMFCEEDIDKNMAEKTSCKIGEGYFLEVEPIPIPGPPGSFLPSPGANIVSEDVRGNSSLTNISRVQSSEDPLDLVDKNPMTLDSPVSATSTIFNPTLTRSDSRSSDMLSVKSIANMVGERNEATLPEQRVSPSLGNDHHLSQESDLLRSRASEGQVNSLTLMPKTFNLGHVPMTAPTATSAANPSSSNPVLRLMGKNLMVAKKDKDIAPAPQFTPPQSTSFDRQKQHIFTAPLPTAPSIPQNKDFYQSLQVLPPFVMPQVHYPYGYDPRHMNSFNHNQWQGSFSYGGPQSLNHASFLMPSSREMINAVSTAVWNHVPEGSSSVGIYRGMNTSLPAIRNRNVPESSVIGVFSSPVHESSSDMMSTTYFPPSLS